MGEMPAPKPSREHGLFGKQTTTRGRVLVVVAALVVMALFTWGFKVFDDHATAVTALPQGNGGATAALGERATESRPPTPMPPGMQARRFKTGRMGTAQGITMPPRVFRLAKQYVLNHPDAAPKHARPTLKAAIASRAAGRYAPIDWGWLEWTAKTLNKARCIGNSWNPSGYLLCNDNPGWLNKVRTVTVYCGGLAVIAGRAAGSTAAGAGAAGCLYSALFNR